MELDLTCGGPLAIESCVVGPIQTNTYFAIAGAHAVAIDPAWDGEALAREFRRRHPNVALDAIVCTHGHADHVGGVAGMRRVLGDVPFLLAAADVPTIARNIADQRIMWGIDTEDPGHVDRELAEGDRIEVGDVTFQVIATPGHTPGGVVLFAATAEGPVAFVGDTLFPGSHGRTDLAGGDEQELMRSLGKLAHLLPPKTHLLCGHGTSTTMAIELAHNPFLPHLA